MVSLRANSGDEIFLYLSTVQVAVVAEDERISVRATGGRRHFDDETRNVRRLRENVAACRGSNGSVVCR